MKKRKKLRSLKDIRKEIWYWLSLRVKLYWCNSKGYCECIVRKTKHYYYKDNLNAGHFIRASRGGITKYMFENIYPQSASSNLLEEQYLMGKQIEQLYLDGKTPYTPLDLYKLYEETPYKENRQLLIELRDEHRKEVYNLAHKKNLWEWKKDCLKKYLLPE